MTLRLLAVLLLAIAALPAQAEENLFAIKIQRRGVDLHVQELIRNDGYSTVRSLQLIPHSKPARAAQVHAFRELARARGAKYFRFEKPYAETVGGQFQIVRFYNFPEVLSLRRLYSVE